MTIVRIKMTVVRIGLAGLMVSAGLSLTSRSARADAVTVS